ncbi:MAG: hypothetical protein ACJ74Y_12610 [Bryobacteraceae bacterium]
MDTKALIFSAILLSQPAITLAASANATPQVTVLVYKIAPIAEAELSTAESEAGRLLKIAGIRVRWAGCPAGLVDWVHGSEPCKNTGDPLTFKIQILSTQNGNRAQDAMGLAHPFEGDGKLADINHAYVAQIAMLYDAPLSAVLGAVMAHELGHILLASDHHSGGIMKGNWSRDELELIRTQLLLFTAGDGKHMRLAVARRAAP